MARAAGGAHGWTCPAVPVHRLPMRDHTLQRDSLKRHARRLFEAGVKAVEPGRAVAQALEAWSPPAPGAGGRLVVVALGKAAGAMTRAALETVQPSVALAVTNHGNADPVAGAEIRMAGHPVPDADGLRAAQAVQDVAQALTARDRLLVLLSGGGSALLPAPVAGVSLQDKITVSRSLLACGADITEMNLVRQQLSRLKGGGLLRAAAPAEVHALILSDVIGDDLRVVASGPTAAPLGTRADARAVLRRHGLWPDLPEAVRAHLQQSQDPALPGEMPRAQNRLIGSNAMALQAMARHDPAAHAASQPLCGDVADAARAVLDRVSGHRGTWLFGGETTVRLRGDGRGGRNQELALRVALLARARGIAGPWVFLSGGTDGRDGPTDAAGAVVDDDTISRIAAAGIDPEAALARNDSYTALAAAGDLLMTGPTGTNVADLQVFCRGTGTRPG